MGGIIPNSTSADRCRVPVMVGSGILKGRPSHCAATRSSPAFLHQGAERPGGTSKPLARRPLKPMSMAGSPPRGRPPLAWLTNRSLATSPRCTRRNTALTCSGLARSLRTYDAGRGKKPPPTLSADPARLARHPSATGCEPGNRSVNYVLGSFSLGAVPGSGNGLKKSGK